MFGFGIMATILTSAYILWMLKRVFFGKIPEEMAHVKEASPYITVTMLVFAALSLTIGIMPDLFLNPITGYVQGMFAGHENVLPLPQHPAAIAPVSLGNESDGVSVQEGISAQTSGGGT
jgi:NADH-quinone oxidoreductase subunit M